MRERKNPKADLYEVIVLTIGDEEMDSTMALLNHRSEDLRNPRTKINPLYIYICIFLTNVYHFELREDVEICQFRIIILYI